MKEEELKRLVKQLIDDMGIDIVNNDGAIPCWLEELAEKIIYAGWYK